jgi:polysaccharide export outer membrane protein
MRIFNLLLITATVFWAASCSTQNKAVRNYLENTSDTSLPILTGVKENIIQKNDLLSIRVYSMSIDPATDIPYNLPEETSGSSSSNTNLRGFLVDASGNIEYPRLGTLHVDGLTKEQLASVIKQKLEGQLTQPSVIVRFMNYKVTVLGEVGAPGTYTVPNEKLTILEALGMAGDVTEFGKKNTIKILRENNGQREIGIVDLTSRDMFQSPYYHLQQNDVVMVEQTQRRIQQQERQNVAQQIGLVTSVITAIALILNFIK